MHSKKWVAILAIALLVAVTLFFLPNDHKRIAGKMDELAENCSSDKGEAVFLTLKKAAAVAKLCTDPCRVTIPSMKVDGHKSQKEISDHLLMIKKRLPGTIFSFHDTTIDLSGEESADVVTTLKLEGQSASGRFVDVYEIDIRMEKNQGDWLFSSFTVVEFINR